MQKHAHHTSRFEGKRNGNKPGVRNARTRIALMSSPSAAETSPSRPMSATPASSPARRPNLSRTASTVRPLTPDLATANLGGANLYGFGRNYVVSGHHYPKSFGSSQFTNDYLSPHRHHHGNGLYMRHTPQDELRRADSRVFRAPIRAAMLTDSRARHRCRRSFLGPLAVTPRGVCVGPRQARSAGGMHTRNKQQSRFAQANHYAAYPPSPPRTFERGGSLRSVQSGGSILLPPPKSPPSTLPPQSSSPHVPQGRDRPGLSVQVH